MKRRKFLLSSVFLINSSSFLKNLKINKEPGPVKFGVVTDPHYANRPPNNTRYYRQSKEKMIECIDLMNQKEVDFLIELGDFKDQGKEPKEKETLIFLDEIEKEFNRFKGPIYHVLGNHDTDSISKGQFLERINNTGFPKALNYYSFNCGSLHFVVLDANYGKNGVSYDHNNINWKDCFVPKDQLNWLKEDLKRYQQPTIVFIHQQLDSSAFNEEHKIFCPYNSDDVRQILEDSGNVLGVFQGHYHSGSFNKINNVFYYTLRAVIEGSGKENNSYLIVEVNSSLEVKILGYRKAKSRTII